MQDSTREESTKTNEQERKPEGIVFYAQTLRNASKLPDAALGQVVKAAVAFFETGVLPEGFDLAQEIIFDMFKDNITAAVENYRKVCERNKENAGKRTAGKEENGDESEPVVTSCNDPPQVEQNMNVNLIESEHEHENKNDFECDCERESEREREPEGEREREHDLEPKHDLEREHEPSWKAHQKQWLEQFDKRN